MNGSLVPFRRSLDGSIFGEQVSQNLAAEAVWDEVMEQRRRTQLIYFQLKRLFCSVGPWA
jgi:hypothetical protein